MRLLFLLLGLGSLPLCFVACSGSSILNASDYDQSCSTSSDCVPVFQGDVACCGGGCANAAINKGALAQYDADYSEAVKVCGVNASCLQFHCPAITAECQGGRCGLPE